MNLEDQAKIILEELDKVLQINWNFEEFYLKAIKKGLVEIKESNRYEIEQENKRLNDKIHHYEEGLLRLGITVEEKLSDSDISEFGRQRILDFSKEVLEIEENM